MPKNIRIGLFAHDSSVAVAPSPRCTFLPSVVRAYNRRVYGYGSCRPSAQIYSRWSQTSYTRQPLCEIAFALMVLKGNFLFGLFCQQLANGCHRCTVSRLAPTIGQCHLFHRIIDHRVSRRFLPYPGYCRFLQNSIHHNAFRRLTPSSSQFHPFQHLLKAHPFRQYLM